MAAKLPIVASRHFDLGGNLKKKKKKKNTLSKEFFNEIWLMTEDYQYIYITEIKWEMYTFNTENDVPFMCF